MGTLVFNAELHWSVLIYIITYRQGCRSGWASHGVSRLLTRIPPSVFLAGVIPILLQSIAILLKFCNTYCNALKFCNTYYNTFKVLQYLLQYFWNFAILITILWKYCNKYCNTLTFCITKVLQYYCNTIFCPWIYIPKFFSLMVIFPNISHCSKS